jgi:hypothetical protein
VWREPFTKRSCRFRADPAAEDRTRRQLDGIRDANCLPPRLILEPVAGLVAGFLIPLGVLRVLPNILVEMQTPCSLSWALRYRLGDAISCRASCLRRSERFRLRARSLCSGFAARCATTPGRGHAAGRASSAFMLHAPRDHGVHSALARRSVCAQPWLRPGFRSNFALTGTVDGRLNSVSGDASPGQRSKL